LTDYPLAALSHGDIVQKSHPGDEARAYFSNVGDVLLPVG